MAGTYILLANCPTCGERVNVRQTGEPTLQPTPDGGWQVVVPADGWDWDLHRISHTGVTA